MRYTAFGRVLALSSHASMHQRGMAGRAGDASRKLLAAKADLLRVRASAETARVGADVAAAARRASAETARAGADAAAAARRASAEMARADADAASAAADVKAVRTAASAAAARSYVAAAAQAAALAGALWLVADLYVHENSEYIDARVRRALRASISAASAHAAAPALPVSQPPPALGFQPLMILGPTGCGKSTLLARVAREAASSSTPFVLVRWRLSESAKRGADAAASAPAEASLAIASEALFQQIDYPRRRAWLMSVLKSGVIVMGQKTQADLALPETCDRLQHALHVLFRAAADVNRERVAAGVPALAAAPGLLSLTRRTTWPRTTVWRARGARLSLRPWRYCSLATVWTSTPCAQW